MTHTADFAPVRRRAGILLHPTSIPAAQGPLGTPARRWVDFLARAGISVWQMLPVGPTHEDNSPYQSLSAHAGNPDFINLDDLVVRGWLSESDLETFTEPAQRGALFSMAAEVFFREIERGASSYTNAYRQFRAENEEWLENYAVFSAVRELHGGQPWTKWPGPLRDREEPAMEAFRQENQTRLSRVRFEQFLFQLQWSDLCRYAAEKGVALFGDVPFFVAHDSAEVWQYRSQFKLAPDGNPLVVAGVPPDYFAPEGQHWGNPIYNWSAMASDGFSWWSALLATQARRFELIRLDHFRGLEACWEIPADDPHPINGRWVPGPGHRFLDACFRSLPSLNLVAENLGVIGTEVEQLREAFGLAGMVVLQFAFDQNPANPHLPHNHRLGDVVYSGTHDNNTTVGWYGALTTEARCGIRDYGFNSAEAIHRLTIRMAFQSVAQLAVIPLQDVLGLDQAARMNVPGTAQGNWSWKFDWNDLSKDVSDQIRHLVLLYGRFSQV